MPTRFSGVTTRVTFVKCVKAEVSLSSNITWHYMSLTRPHLFQVTQCLLWFIAHALKTEHQKQAAK